MTSDGTEAAHQPCVRDQFYVPGMVGTLINSGDAEWDEARRAWKQHVDQRPAAIAIPSTPADVSGIVRSAAAAGLRVTAQSTGHNPVPLGDLSSTVLIRTHGLDGVEIDADRRIARIGSGVRWLSVVSAAARHGLAALTGTSGGVGAAGYLLGGGIGWFTRSHGLGCLSIRAADIVLADGMLVRTDEHNHPDLLWALRGGGGGFGIVTAFEIDLYPVDSVHGGLLAWPIEHAPAVFELWREWSENLPVAASTICRLLRAPAGGGFPKEFWDRDLVIVECAFQVGDDMAASILAPLRARSPEFDTFRRMDIPELATLHMDPQAPFPSPGGGALLESLTRDAVQSLVETASDPANDSLRSIEVRRLGGAGRPTRPSFAAVSGFDADASIFAVGPAPTPEAVDRVTSALRRLLASTSSVMSVSGYSNFIEESAAPSHVFGSALERLVDIKHRYDPSDRVHANHPVLPRSEFSTA